jgi:hypothetical protein
MIHVLFASVLLWLAVGTAVWAYLGVLAASHSRIPVVAGAAVGALTWFVGIVALLIAGHVRSQSRIDRTGYAVGDAFAVPGRPAAAALWQPNDPFAAPVNLPTQHGWSSSADPFADAAPPWTSGVAAASRVRSTASASGPLQSDRTKEALLTGALAAFGVALLLATFLPWGDGGVAWSHGHSHFDVGVAPIDATPVAVSMVGSGLLVIVAAMLARRQLRGTWLALAILVAAWWFWLISEWLVAQNDVGIVSAKVNDAIGRGNGGRVTIDYGTWVAYLSCLGIAAVAVVAAARLVSLRSRNGGGVRV